MSVSPAGTAPSTQGIEQHSSAGKATASLCMVCTALFAASYRIGLVNLQLRPVDLYSLFQPGDLDLDVSLQVAVQVCSKNKTSKAVSTQKLAHLSVSASKKG